jgi:flagellar protein FliL
MAAQQQPKSFQESELADAPQHIDPAPKKRGKLLLILCLVLVLAGGGAAGVYFMQPAHSDAGATAKPPVFVPLDTFTVNLVSDPAHMQFMQAAITLKLTEKATAELIKERLPEVRDRVLIVLSARRSSEILSVAGKQKLAVDIAEAVKKVIVPTRVPSPGADVTAAVAEPAGETPTQPASEPAPAKSAIEVLFTSFIVQ